MNRLLAALALFSCACALREPRTTGQSGEPCSNNEDCDSSVCFLGECRAPSAALSTVYAEVRTADSRYGTLQQSIDLRATALADFTLQPLLNVSGHVFQRSDPPGPDVTVPGAAVVFTDLSPKIPDRVASISTQSDSSGTYTANLPASRYQVLVAPPNLPVEQFPAVQGSNTSLDLALPSATSLSVVHGILVNGSTPLANAQVSAVDASGTSIAGTQLTAADGSFSLQLPPGPPAFSLQVGPPASAPASDPIPSFTQKPFAAGRSDLGTVDLGALPPSAILTGSVVDARGAPVASARVLLLSTGVTGYVLSRQAVTDFNGSFSVAVRQGNYLVQAMPDVDPQAPAISATPVAVTITASAFDLGTPLKCLDKIRVTGTVVRPDGHGAPAGFRVEATRVADQVIPGRGTQAATTDANGAFTLVVDGGKYRVTITPTADSGLPRTIVTVDLPATTPPVLHIAPPHELLGTARAESKPVAVNVDFYALDSSGKRSVLIGSAVGDATSGQYKVVLPDVPQPAGQ